MLPDEFKEQSKKNTNAWSGSNYDSLNLQQEAPWSRGGIRGGNIRGLRGRGNRGDHKDLFHLYRKHKKDDQNKSKARNFLASPMRTNQQLERSNPCYFPDASSDKPPSGDAFKADRLDSFSDSDKDSLSSPSLDDKLDEQINPNRADTFAFQKHLNDEDNEIIDENKILKYENLSESEDN